MLHRHHLQVLGHISKALSRSLICCPELRGQGLLPCSPAVWLQAVLREVDAAQAAHKQWLAAASAVAGSRSGDPMKGWLEGMNWECLSGIMTLAAAVAAPGAPGAAAGGGAAFGKQNGSVIPHSPSTPAPGRYLPAGILSCNLLCAVLCHALDSLQWTVSESGSDLVHLLRCLRHVWVLLAVDEQLQVGYWVDWGQAKWDGVQHQSVLVQPGPYLCVIGRHEQRV